MGKHAHPNGDRSGEQGRQAFWADPTADCTYPTLSYANSFTTMLFVSFGVLLLVYALAAWAGARRAQRFGAGLGAAMLALLINTLIFIAASCAASATRLNPLTFDQTDQDALVVTLVYTIVFALLVALGTLVSASIGASIGQWQGKRAQARERAYAQASAPAAPPFTGYPPGGF